MPKSAKRRFVGLATEEVSLVDTPANEVEFLVTKQEAEIMGADAAKAATKERVSVETDVGSSDVAKALEHVNGIVAKISSIVTKSESSAAKGGNDDDDDQDDSDDSQEPTDIDTSKAAASELRKVLMAAGLEGDALKTAMKKAKASGLTASLEKAFPPKPGKGGKGAADDEDEDDKKPKKKVKKAAAHVEDDSDDADDNEQPLTMTALAEAVNKAAAFTPARIAALKDAHDILKLVLESVTPGTSPATKVPALSTHGNQTGIASLSTGEVSITTKSKDGDALLVDTLKSLSAGLEKVSERLDKIESARGESNSADNEGTTDTKKAASSSIWSGVL